jgi:hypothetical protein
MGPPARFPLFLCAFPFLEFLGDFGAYFRTVILDQGFGPLEGFIDVRNFGLDLRLQLFLFGSRKAAFTALILDCFSVYSASFLVW